MRLDAVLVKLAAVFIVVSALRNLSDYAYFFVGAEANAPIFFGVALVFVVPVCVAFVLWRFPNLVIGSFAPRDPVAPTADVSADKLLLIGISLLGLYTLVFGIIDLVYFEAYRFGERAMARAADYDMPISMHTVAGRVTNVVQILFGVALLAGRHGIADFVRRARTAGGVAD